MNRITLSRITFAAAFALCAASAATAAPLDHSADFSFPESVGEPKTRAQVRAETLEAIRIGAINFTDRFDSPSAQQLESIRLAGLRALVPTVAATVIKPSAN